MQPPLLVEEPDMSSRLFLLLASYTPRMRKLELLISCVLFAAFLAKNLHPIFPIVIAFATGVA